MSVSTRFEILAPSTLQREAGVNKIYIVTLWPCMNSDKNITIAIDTIATDTHFLETMTKETLTSADLSRMTIECLVNAPEQRDYSFDEHDPDGVDWKEDGENDEKIEFERYQKVVEKQRKSIIDETEGVFKLRDPSDKDRIEVITKLNQIIHGMVKNAKSYKDRGDIEKYYSRNEYRVRDYHPGSSNVVLDIIHPSLFPYIENCTTLTSIGKAVRRGCENDDKNKGYAEKTKSSRPENFQASPGVDDAVIDSSEQDNASESYDMWGRRYYT